MARKSPPGRKRAARLSSAASAIGEAMRFSVGLFATAVAIFRAPISLKYVLSRRRKLQHFVHRRQQMPRAERFAEHAKDAALFGVVWLQVISTRRQHDRRDLAGRRILLQP